MTPNYLLNHARSGSNSCSASTAPQARFDLAAPAGAILTRADFHELSRAAGPGLTSCGNRPEQPATEDHPCFQSLAAQGDFTIELVSADPQTDSHVSLTAVTRSPPET
jgi:hypothetical protein